MLAAVALTAPGLGFLLPFLGPWLALLLLSTVVRSAGPVLWGRGRADRKLTLLAGAGLWLPGALTLAIFLVVGTHLGSPTTPPWLALLAELVSRVGVTYWLFLPLAGPEDVLTPASTAIAALAVGAAASAGLRRPGPWLCGALVAPLVYAATVQLLDIPFVS